MKFRTLVVLLLVSGACWLTETLRAETKQEFVLVGKYAHTPNDIKALLKRYGYHFTVATIERPDEQRWYQLLVGPYASINDGQMAIQKLAADGFASQRVVELEGTRVVEITAHPAARGTKAASSKAPSSGITDAREALPIHPKLKDPRLKRQSSLSTQSSITTLRTTAVMGSDCVRRWELLPILTKLYCWKLVIAPEGISQMDVLETSQIPYSTI